MQKPIVLFFVTLLIYSCVDRLTFDTESPVGGTLVIDGQITDEPGPYTIRLVRASGPNEPVNFANPFIASKVTLYDSEGDFEELKTDGSGVWRTDPNGIQGIEGRKYHLRIDLSNGTSIESTPDEMRPVKDINRIYYEWEAILPIHGPTQYGFRIFIDTKETENSQNYLRWRFSGAYVVESFPELNRFGNNCGLNFEPDPFPCSGFVVAAQQAGGTFLEKVGDCTCCFCWVSDFESKPKLNDNVVGTDGTYKKIEVGYVPFNQWTFGFNKYMVKVEQMSLTREAYDFWKIFKDQKEEASSLFQPSFGKAKTNFISTNPDLEVVGFFSASSIKKKLLFLTSADAQTNVPPYDIEPPETNCALWRRCTDIFPNASTTPPKDWE